jgi:hypothetical protein
MKTAISIAGAFIRAVALATERHHSRGDFWIAYLEKLNRPIRRKYPEF